MSFPVPDGDTGDNLVHTLKPVYDQIDAIGEPRLDNLAARLAAEMLMSAKGNSGVIFSQFFFSFAKALKGKADDRPGRFQPGHGKGRARDLRIHRRTQGRHHPDRAAPHAPKNSSAWP